MRVECIATSLTDEQKIQLKMEASNTVYQIVPGNTYLVLAITFMLPAEPHGGGVHYQILNDFGDCRSVPAYLFRVADARASRYWVARQDSDGSLLLWPEEFYTRFFHDDLSEGENYAVNIFEQIVNKMQLEYGLS